MQWQLQRTMTYEEHENHVSPISPPECAAAGNPPLP